MASVVVGSREDRLREAARIRMRRLRTTQRSERSTLHTTLKMLEQKLASLHEKMHRTARAAPTNATRNDDLIDAHRTKVALRKEVDEQYKLAHLLYMWVASQQPVAHLPTRSSWMESTLVASPEARRQGFQWLSDRVYHNAINAAPKYFAGDKVDDMVRFAMHTSNDESDAGPHIVGTEFHVQHTFFANFSAMARIIWGDVLKGQSKDTYGHVRPQIAERIHDRLVYFSGVYNGFGKHLRRIDCMYEEADRVVMTYTYVTDDECFPIEDGEIRASGYAWVIAQRVTDSITLVHHSVFHFAPVTAHGVASLDQMGQFYGQTIAPTKYPEAYIEQIGSMSEKVNAQRMQTLVRMLAYVAAQLEANRLKA
ncbi:Aste57867_15840 [Aphanomyces stellatus]|uniref:Aste57867_15840 protein n=1 Tax=Aphanomyces stellatus TaxID=120398 RepID=A0A485L4D2_9STRA|nr:hypothetical protein As57867_015784 [Aphanomyces stellatus]VFT92627.1 Aste57867_15840 [Aphanomyces stellatus]